MRRTRIPLAMVLGLLGSVGLALAPERPATIELRSRGYIVLSKKAIRKQKRRRMDASAPQFLQAQARRGARRLRLVKDQINCLGRNSRLLDVWRLRELALLRQKAISASVIAKIYQAP